MPKKKKLTPGKIFWYGGLLGLIAGLIFVYFKRRPPMNPTLSFLIGVKPSQSDIVASDGVTVSTWEVPGQLDQIKDEAASELSLTDGWQPPVLRQSNPPIWQIVRVKLPNGDFQFSRWVFLSAGKNEVRVERSLGPRGGPIPSGR